MVATRANLGEMLEKGPKILHISCHGIQNNEKTRGRHNPQMQKEGGFLLLEKENGEGDLVS